MKLIILALLSLSPLFAHSGHPGAATHGTFTHLLIGTAVALPIALVLLRAFTGTPGKAKVKVRKKD